MSAFSSQIAPDTGNAGPGGWRTDDRVGDRDGDRGDGHKRRSSHAVRRESKLTIGGLVYIAVTVFLAIGAINSQNNLLFWLFGVAIATLIVSGLFSGNALMKLRLEAQSVSDSYAGDTLLLKYTLRNRSRFFPLFAAMISEVPDRSHPPARFEPAAVLHLGPGRSGTYYGTVSPDMRGRHSLRTIRLSTRFPFGLLQKSLVFQQHRTMLVLPAQIAIKPDLVRIDQGRGEEVRTRTATRGSSSEYWGLREYRPGDPQRSIAWKPSARRSALVVIEHAQPIATRLWVWVVGPRREHEDPNTQERALALAAALVVMGSERGVPVGLWMPTQGLRIPSATGRRHIGRCLRALAMVDLAREGGADAPPPASVRDDTLAITRDDHPVSFPAGAGRRLNADEPGQWLIDPASLPALLGGRA